MRKLSKKQRAALIADVFEARRDLTGLADAHRLTPDDLAEWIGRAENHRTLTDLCRLADLQTQLMLSRYRQVAVSELIKQASGGDETSAEQARKACVDLLKTDLRRADTTPEASQVEDDVSAAQREAASIREALFGDDKNLPAEGEGCG
ncbi:MAG: hypothetical protein AAF710_00645 [Planctomycetota bacterium]